MTSYRVVVCGPPHSGKSCFLYGLCKVLERQDYFLLRACPDGEGSWTYRSWAGAGLRKKGEFSQSFMDWVLNSLRNVHGVPLVLVDVGGRRSRENEEIFRECQGFIVLSADEAEMDEWRRFGETLGLECLALIRSELEGKDALETRLGEVPVRGCVSNLQRGQDNLRVTVVHDALAVVLREKIAAVKKAAAEGKEVGPMTGPNLIFVTTQSLSQRLGKQLEPRTLPDGRVIQQLVWKGEDIPRIDEVCRELSAKPADGYVLDGPAPAWLGVVFVHGLHPQAAYLNDPRLGPVLITGRKPEGKGQGKNLTFKTVELDELTLVEFEVVGGVFDVADLSDVVPPAVNTKKGVILSGRGPNWLSAKLALSYHLCRWVALWQPGSGATVAMSHYPSRRLGEVIPDEVVLEARKRFQTT